MNGTLRTGILRSGLAALLLLGASAALAQTRALQMTRSESAFPTGDRNTSIVLLERFAPLEVRAGEDFTYEVKITNLTRGPLSDVIITEQFPPTFTPRTVAPEPSRRGSGDATWQVSTLGSGQAIVMQFTGNTTRQDDVIGCASITFAASVCSTTKVVEPKLALVKSLPEEVLLCDDVPMRLVVTNTGSGVARNVKITDALPAGLASAQGGNSLAFDAGDLGPGQSREFTAMLRAARTGDYVNTAQARDDTNLAAEASDSVKVRNCALSVTKRGPDFRFLGRPATFEITVTNSGDAPARDAVLLDNLPAGMQFVEADSGGVPRGNGVEWALGTIAPGASKTVKLSVTASQPGRFENTAAARAYCCEAAGAAPIEIRGIPAILLEVIDLDDPVEVGRETTYEIAVVNQGSAVGTNIVIECTLPQQEQLVSADGPVAHQAQGQTIRFAPLPSLAPKARAVYRVVIRGLAAGDVRFRVSMKSDQIETTVDETESTRIY